LFRASRQLGDWDGVVKIYELFSENLKKDTNFQLIAGHAYGRLGRFKEALRILEPFIRKQPSAEAYAILARTYKDMAHIEESEGSPSAQRHLKQSAEAYLQSYALDPQSYNNALNAASLLARLGEEEKLTNLLPRIKSILERNIKNKERNFWDVASLLEVLVIDGDRASVERLLPEFLSTAEFSWQVATTINNLKYIRDAATKRGDSTDWMDSLIDTLSRWESDNE
jgi:tetratricopeptide (TPR) repeat protein